MGLGRRKFMQIFGATLATLSVSPSSAIAIIDDLYINRKLGIAFRKPSDWTFSDVKEMGMIKARQVLDLDDGESLRDLYESSDLPILVIGQEEIKGNSSHFSPGITINYEKIALFEKFPDFTDLTISTLHSAVDDGELCKSWFPGFKITSEPQKVEISESEAAEYKAEFMWQVENMRPTRVRMHTLMLFQRPAVYTIRMYDSTHEPNCTFDYSEFIDSIRLV